MMTEEQIEQYQAQLETILDAGWDSDCGYFRAAVEAPDATEYGEEEYEVRSEIAIDAIRAALPGWAVEWTGNGNTDSSGVCTEDIHLIPPA